MFEECLLLCIYIYQLFRDKLRRHPLVEANSIIIRILFEKE